MLDETDNSVYCAFSLEEREGAMTKSVNLTREEVAQYISYDPETGVMLRRERSGQRGKVGSDATTVRKATDGRGQHTFYRWVWLHGVPIPAARIAWLLVHGEWPKTRVLFENGDTLDIKIKNLKEGEFKSVRLEGKKHSTRSSEDGRAYSLKNVYGMTLGEHEQMLVSQGRVCKVCGKEESRRHKVDGSAVALHVDHDHATGKVRGLLCHKCNVGLGSFNDDPALLRAAADYLDKHKDASNVIPIEGAA
jgi:hypothetical protein